VCISDRNGRKGHPMPENKLGHSAPELWRTACPRDERLQLPAAFGRSLWVLTTPIDRGWIPQTGSTRTPLGRGGGRLAYPRLVRRLG
jgi:hypothetical protein